MNKNQIKGRTNTATGKTKEVIGDVIGNDELKYKGKLQKVRGQVESTYGDARNDLDKTRK